MCISSDYYTYCRYFTLLMNNPKLNAYAYYTKFQKEKKPIK